MVECGGQSKRAIIFRGVVVIVTGLKAWWFSLGFRESAWEFRGAKPGFSGS